MDVDVLDGVISAAQLGQEWAWTRLYQDVAPSLHAYFRVRGSRNADDLVGETFVQLARNLSKFEGDASSFRSWVFMIAHHRLSNERRRFLRRPEVLSAEPSRDICVDHSAEDEALSVAGTEAAMSMLDGLTRDQRNVIALRFIVDLSVEETARIVGTSSGAVKQLTRRALQKLRSTISHQTVTQ